MLAMVREAFFVDFDDDDVGAVILAADDKAETLLWLKREKETV